MALAVAEEQTTKTELTADDLWQHPTIELTLPKFSCPLTDIFS